MTKEITPLIHDEFKIHSIYFFVSSIRFLRLLCTFCARIYSLNRVPAEGGSPTPVFIRQFVLWEINRLFDKRFLRSSVALPFG